MRTKQETKDGVERVIQQIYNEHGSVKASALLEHARSETSPAHDGFEWNDQKAAHEFRLNTARQWIRIVRIKPTEQSTHAERMIHIPIRTEQMDRGDSLEGEYKPLSVVQNDPDEYARARAAAVAALKSAAAALDELDSIASREGKSAISAIISQLSRGIDAFEKALIQLH